MSKDAKPIRVLYCKAPCCPECGSHELFRYGLVKRKPPAKIQYARCLSCKQRIHINIS